MGVKKKDLVSLYVLSSPPPSRFTRHLPLSGGGLADRSVLILLPHTPQGLAHLIDTFEKISTSFGQDISPFGFIGHIRVD